MDKLTYRQAYDKIIEAYFKDEIKPLMPNFCFCGTLNKNDSRYWIGFKRKEDGFYYSGIELQKMEVELLVAMGKFLNINLYSINTRSEDIERHPLYEAALFAGMSAALDVLREIHRSRGEDVDGEFTPFTKRELVKTL